MAGTPVYLHYCHYYQYRSTSLILHRYNDKLQRIQRGEKVVDELFTYACPKFVAAVPPRLDDLTVNSNQEAYRHQLREFMAFVDQQRQLPVLKQFLKLYTTISLPKLAALMDTDESSVKEQLRVLEVCAFFCFALLWRRYTA